LLFNFALEYTIRRVHVKQDGLKLTGTHQLLVYAGDVNIVGGSVHTVKENAESSIVASKEIGKETTGEIQKQMVRIILRCIFRKWDVGAGTGSI